MPSDKANGYDWEWDRGHWDIDDEFSSDALVEYTACLVVTLVIRHFSDISFVEYVCLLETLSTWGHLLWSGSWVQASCHLLLKRE